MKSANYKQQFQNMQEFLVKIDKKHKSSLRNSLHVLKNQLSELQQKLTKNHKVSVMEFKTITNELFQNYFKGKK